MKPQKLSWIETLWVGLLTLGLAPAVWGQAPNVQPRVTEPVDLTKLVTLHGNTHPLARAQYDHGRAPDSLPVRRALLVLKRSPEQEAELRQLLDAQQTKSSPDYHRWLVPDEFGARFGPADHDIQAVTGWLTSEGFVVNQVSPGRTVIEFSGTAGLLREALHTTLHQYVVDGRAHWANSTDPEIPAALAPVVAGFASLNNFPRHSLTRVLGPFEKNRATGQIRPLFTFSPAAGLTFFALGPTDFATIYNVLPLWTAGTDGTGQTIAIVADSNINIQDARDFRKIFNLPTNDPHIILNGPDPGITPSEIEADADVEWSGAVAKGATVDLVVSEDTEVASGPDLSELYVVNHNLAPVLSISFGLCEADLGTGGNAFEAAVFEQAAAQGITVLVAAGDQGSAGCDTSVEFEASRGLAVSGVASTPFDVALGGTDFNDGTTQTTYWNATNDPVTQASAKSYIPESTWNDSCAAKGMLTGCGTLSPFGLDLVAGGGGPSSCTVTTAAGACMAGSGYPKPVWQTGVGVPADGVRDLPDVSLFSGDGTSTSASFYIICESDRSVSGTCDLNSPFFDFLGVGGTSLAAPSFAGMMALVNQKFGRQGQANFVLYPLAALAGASCPSNTAAVTNASCIFYDNVTGNISVACAGGTPNCSSTTAGTNGILVDPLKPTDPAWLTTPGYDRASGLGSVNAANLVNNWTKVSFQGTTTNLVSLVPSTLTHGSTVTATISVSPSSATGDVSLLGGPTGSGGIAFFTLSNGQVVGQTNALPGGSYNVTAHYAGNGTLGASDSKPVAVTVTPESSLATVSVVTLGFGNAFSQNATTAPYGSLYFTRVDVTNAAGQSCTVVLVPCPTGQVTVSDNGGPPPDESAPASATPGVFTLNSLGFTEDQFNEYPVGMHTLVAKYAGDSSFTASTSPSDTISITTASTTTTVFASSTAGLNQNVTLTALVGTQSFGVAPTGTVQFTNNGAPIAGTVTLTPTPGSLAGAGVIASLQATLVASFTANASISAQYTSGDTNYANSASTTPATITIADFSLTASPTTISIASAGQSGSTMVSIAPVGAFTGPVSVACVLPIAMKEATCSASPLTITGSGMSTSTISTTGSHTVGSLWRLPPWIAPLGGLLLVSLLLFGLSRQRRWKFAFGFASVGLLALALAGCGSSTFNRVSDPGTPPGTYTVTINASGGGITHSTTVTVTVG